MLRRLRDMQGWTMAGRDAADVGTIDDFYIDDEQWTVRYIVVNVGNWLAQNDVLISPLAVDRVDWGGARIVTDLTRDLVQRAPQADTKAPISRRYESSYFGYYGYPAYWIGPGAWGVAATPTLARQAAEVERDVPPATEEESHLRSMQFMSGHHVQALDGEIGHVEDFLVDDESWTIRYFVIDTSNWIGGRTVLVAPEWTRRVEWARKLVHVDLTRKDVEESPRYEPAMEIDRAYEDKLYAHYRQPAYWVAP